VWPTERGLLSDVPVQAVIPGPFVTMVRGTEDAIAWRRAHAPECSRCGSDDRLRYFAHLDDIFGLWSARALCYSCDDLGLTAGSRPRRPHSSLRAFYLWLLAAFIAGVLVTLAIAALLSTSSRGANSGQTSEIEGSAVRAGRMVEARSADEGMADQRDRAGSTSPSSTDPARIITATDETPASDASVLTTRSGSLVRDDPALVVRASPVPRSLVVDVGRRYGIDGERFADVMFCESSLRPDAVGAGGRAHKLAHHVNFTDVRRKQTDHVLKRDALARAGKADDHESLAG